MMFYPVRHCSSGNMHALSLIHISEPTRQEAISYAVFCLKKINVGGRSADEGDAGSHAGKANDGLGPKPLITNAGAPHPRQEPEATSTGLSRIILQQPCVQWSPENTQYPGSCRCLPQSSAQMTTAVC